MRLNFPNVPLTTHRNVFFICVASAVVLGGAYFVYSKLIRELEEIPFTKPQSFEDAKIWLQALLLAFCIFISGAVYSFFSLYRC